ncbi:MULTISPECIES: flagellar hook-length control protein FliK [Nitrosomonas]|uniref:Flagellar hook-length control protein FliK n=2 Tax=Nitrosomonas eutropha TaxID=916 RepID=A0ABX5MA06_9PROT|nr:MULTISPECIES: flagellar hook-length control protein FliK [Nitrosomonas]ABI59010.1 flagellar hook-length control protein [Nitrosomonas eutropha C91]MXS80819.1 flagellar hook-length control protein FliK [Nitrosomonas sp. GH22]PXV82244.1 flagellar hook-length control protein FliK [Nitrosomonas eutropha]SCX24616.1 flagellar hook-length control protein FliK [Nitrosomonas eutropha]SDW41917.1 flagellar hook-length control protein FliK [Nitrosomonas eutropha]
MPNLPAIPDMGLRVTTSDLMTTILPGASIPSAPGQPVEQAFGNILTSVMENKPTAEEDDTENLELALPTDALMPGMMSIPVSQWINLPQPTPDIQTAELLSRPPTSTASNAGQYSASLLLTTDPIELTDVTKGISNLASTSTNGFNQVIDAADFADSDRIQPASMTYMISNTGQLVTSEPDILTRGNPSSAEPENRISNGQHLASSLQTINQVNTTTPSIELSDGNRSISNTAPISTPNFDQAIDAANFVDSSKALSTSMMPVAMHTSITDTATADAMNNAPAIAAEFGHPDWPEEFGRKITWLATQRMQAAELKLHPAHLGPIEISLQLSDDHQLTAQFVSHHTAVREAIEANLPRLREIMAENGITLADTSVSADTPQQQAESERDNSSRSSGNNRFPNNSIGTHTPVSLITRHSGIIDTFA